LAACSTAAVGTGGAAAGAAGAALAAGAAVVFGAEWLTGTAAAATCFGAARFAFGFEGAVDAVAADVAVSVLSITGAGSGAISGAGALCVSVVGAVVTGGSAGAG
jgi:hypothetical protein